MPGGVDHQAVSAGVTLFDTTCRRHGDRDHPYGRRQRLRLTGSPEAPSQDGSWQGTGVAARWARSMVDASVMARGAGSAGMLADAAR